MEIKMVKDIYSDLWAEQLISEIGDIRVYLYKRGNKDKPDLILENLLCAKRLRDYLDKLIKKHKKYFERVGEPLK